MTATTIIQKEQDAAPVIMTKEQALEVDAKIKQTTEDWFHTVGPLLLEIRDHRGWEALGFNSFNDYCRNLDTRFQDKKLIYRLVDRAEVEQVLGQEIPAQHAYL